MTKPLLHLAGTGAASAMAEERELVLLGINHQTAPLEVRERLAIPAARLEEAYGALLGQSGVGEGLVLSTCNRIEILATVARGEAARLSAGRHHDLLPYLESFFAVSAASLVPHLYEYRGREAVRHLFRVASSLDSLVVGEAQILGQVKESWTVARATGAIGTTLDPLLQNAFSVAKKVRSETQIGSSSVSIASVAVDLARKIFGSLSGRQVLLVGAGKMAELAARHLIQHGVSTIFLSNRTEQRARRLAEEMDAQLPTQIIPFEALYEHAHRADIVITSTGATATGATGKLFTPAHGRKFLERRRQRPMFFIDIAVPRDVDPGLNKVDGCFVYDLDDLQQVTMQNMASRSREAELAESIVDREVERYTSRQQAMDAVPTIRAMQERMEQLRQAEMERSASRLGDLSPAQMEAVAALTRSLTAKMLHAPMAAARDAAGAGDAATLEQLRALFSEPAGREARRSGAGALAIDTHRNHGS